MIVRLLIWDVFDSKTTVEELRGTLLPLDPPSFWMWNEATERLGAIAYGDEEVDALGWAQDLIGAEPAVYEEFEVL